MGKRRRISRRDFLRTAAGVTLAGATGAIPRAQEDKKTQGGVSRPPTARVVLVRNRRAASEGSDPKSEILPRMLDDAVTALTGRPDPVAAWRQLVRPDDTLGIKSNVWRFLRTPPALEEAIRNRAIDAGVSPERIDIGDRGILRSPIFREATALVNVRPMRTHHWSGVGSLIKNYIMFVEEPWTWHGDSCADLAGIWDLPIVKGKTRLNVLVMLTPLFHSKGPHAFKKEYTWPYGGLLVGTDPVAVDATGLRILEAKREEHFGLRRPFATSPKHIQVAAEKFRLGVADPAGIELIRLGWKEGALV